MKDSRIESAFRVLRSNLLGLKAETLRQEKCDTLTDTQLNELKFYAQLIQHRVSEIEKMVKQTNFGIES